MGWGQKTIDQAGLRDALLKAAAADMMGGKITERSYLAALLVEQVKTNELLERLLTEK